MASYVENFKSYTDWGTVIVRSNKTPLDRTSIFGSLDDAKKYAKGDGTDANALGKTSYVGQYLAVYENGVVDIYQITEKKELRKVIHEVDLETAKTEIYETIQLNKDRLISQEGSSYDCANGVLTLATDDASKTITIQLTGDYGTF
jgi:hypothetical protein